MTETPPCPAHPDKSTPPGLGWPCSSCEVERRDALLVALAKDPPRSVEGGPSTHAGFDKAACACGPKARFVWLGADMPVDCAECSRPAPGAVVAAFVLDAWQATFGDRKALGACPLCSETGLLADYGTNKSTCLACGERFDRMALYRAPQAKAPAVIRMPPTVVTLK
ncbi:MAG TPA: hypothetical protein VFS43_38310 [Polyangiaceae bacterium]|nr:hypothetical protein [Polyangiaceae bacterium]